ncbi:Coenzyme PQQ synthesis protein E [Bienertia sinuspersici]
MHLLGIQQVYEFMFCSKCLLAFKGYDTDPNWVLSITTLSRAYNGTTRTYYDGIAAKRWNYYETRVFTSALFDIPWLNSYYNFGFDHFNISWNKIGVWGLVDCLLGNAGPFSFEDWILSDLTIQGINNAT